MNLLANACDAIRGRGNLWIRTARDERRTRRDRHPRRRRRASPRTRRPRLRSLLHDQAGRQGHGSRARDHAWHREPSRRHDPRRRRSPAEARSSRSSCHDLPIRRRPRRPEELDRCTPSSRYVPPDVDADALADDQHALDYKTYPMLFVDDEQPLIETLRLNYERGFHGPRGDGRRQALDILAREPVAVLVTDQRMPEMSGLEVIQRALDAQARRSFRSSSPATPTSRPWSARSTSAASIATSRSRSTAASCAWRSRARSKRFTRRARTSRLARGQRAPGRRAATRQRAPGERERLLPEARRRGERLRRDPRAEPGDAARDRARAPGRSRRRRRC